MRKNFEEFLQKVIGGGMQVLLSFVLMLALTGCSLAKEDAGEEAQVNTDRLVGAFITTEYLDLFDMEAYLNDNIDEIMDDGNVTVGQNSEYNGRLYATIDKKNSTEPSDWEVSFGDVEGICFFDATWEHEDGESFSMLTAGDEICDMTQHLSVTDEGTTVELTGKMYALVGEGVEEISFYVNPVYQTETGEIYVTSGNGHSMTGDIGGSFTVTLEEENTVTENAESEVYGGKVALTVEILHAAPEKVRFHFLDSNLVILHTEEYVAGEVPYGVQAAEGAVCVVVETEWADDEITRELVEPEDGESTYVEVFYKVSDITLGKQNTEVIWE